MSEAMMPTIGDQFAGHRIESLLGRGGMGVVYVAEHIGLQRKVALKVLPPELAQDESFRRRFIRESRLAAQLEHPNIVPIHEAGEVEGILYISMRYIRGSDLKILIQSEGALHATRAIFLLGQVANALDEAHSEELVHRDVKSQNILISQPRGRGREAAYLSDFGLTKHYDSKTGITGTGMMVGTVDYIAPEQLEAGHVDARADVYSLGCVLYECLAGTVPYERPSMPSRMMAHLNAAPPLVTATRIDLSPDIDRVVAMALAKSPSQRYASCGELLEAAAGAVAVDRRAPDSSSKVIGGGTVIGPDRRADLRPDAHTPAGEDFDGVSNRDPRLDPSVTPPNWIPPPGAAGDSHAPPEQVPRPNWAPHKQPQGSNRLAVASLIFGILWVFWIGSIAALILGYMAKRQIDRSGGREGGRGMATAGIVVGWIGIGLFVLGLIAISTGA
jgi:serine/threonine protein kinase